MIQPGVNVTKSNAYAVLAPVLGAGLTKSLAYAPLGPSPLQFGVNISKAIAYAIVAPLEGENVTKTLAYSILSGQLVQSSLPSAAGSKRRLDTCKKENWWDRCLYEEMSKFARIQFPPPLCAMPAGLRDLLPWDDETSALPYQAKRFSPVGSVRTPLPADGDKVVVSLTVPMGYDGFLTGAYWFYAGRGFTQGSGDILWRIQVNQRYLKDFCNIPFMLGSPQLPFPLTEGQIALCGQTIRGIVNAPNLSGLIQPGSMIVFALLGFFWPRGTTGELATMVRERKEEEVLAQ